MIAAAAEWALYAGTGEELVSEGTLRRWRDLVRTRVVGAAVSWLAACLDLSWFGAAQPWSSAGTGDVILVLDSYVNEGPVLVHENLEIRAVGPGRPEVDEFDFTIGGTLTGMLVSLSVDAIGITENFTVQNCVVHDGVYVRTQAAIDVRLRDSEFFHDVVIDHNYPATGPIVAITDCFFDEATLRIQTSSFVDVLQSQFIDSNVVGMAAPGGTNISDDPLFCGLCNLTLTAGSPCLPPGNPCGQLIGALGEGCSGPPIPVESTTWGAIKARFR